MASISYKRKISPLTYLRYFCEAAGVYILYIFFALLPVGVASWIGGGIAKSLFPHFAASRKADRNLQFAMPHLSKAERKKIIKGMWENLGRVFAEYPHLNHLSKRIKVVSGGQYLEKVQSQAAIMVGGHFANWEVYAAAAKLYGVGLNLVYRPPNNIFVDGLLRFSRARAGAVSAIPKTVEGARQMMSALKNGEALGALIDQKFNEGIAVPFFGHDAMTAPAVIQMGIRQNIPVHPARIRRTHGANFEVTIYPPLSIPAEGDRNQKTYAVLCKLHNLFEEWIIADPAQWLWLHKRWTNR